MAYEYNAEQAQSILTQVAFKEANEYARGTGIDLLTEEGLSDFDEVFSALQNRLVDAEKRARAAIPATTTTQRTFTRNTPRTSEDQRDAIKDAFPDATEEQADAPPVRIVGKKDFSSIFGPLPDWAIAEAQAKGIEKLFDKRDWAMQPSKSGNPRPWFIEAPDVPQGASQEERYAAYDAGHPFYHPDGEAPKPVVAA